MTGEVVVCGLITGVHLIQDIGVTVPHQVAVRIPAEAALRSKDLWMGIQQGFLFKLSAGTGLNFAAPANPTPAPMPAPMSNPGLEAENRKLRADNQRLESELAAERQRNQSLQNLLAGLNTGLANVHTALEKLESSPRVVTVAAGGSTIGAPEVVGGAAPTFIPDRILPENVETQIHTEKETTDRSNLSSAASRLRDLRRQSGG